MGMDVYSSSGVVLTVEDAANAIFGKLRKKQVDAAVAFTRAGLLDYEPHAKLLEPGEMLCALTHVDIQDGKQLAAWYTDVVNKNINDDSPYGTPELDLVWKLLVDGAGLDDVPRITLEYWNSPRLCGFSVPIGVPCVVIDSSEFFDEPVLHEYGQKLAKLLKLKRVNISTWTNVSF